MSDPELAHVGLPLGKSEGLDREQAETAIFGFWLFLMSDAVLFALLFATYGTMLASTVGGPTPASEFKLLPTFVETLLLLTSSATFGRASVAMTYREPRRVLIGWLVVTLGLDLIGGYKVPISGGALDVGLTWYMYPGGASKTDFAEPYVKLSGTAGPVSMLAGVAYAPKQQALGKWYNNAAAYATGVPNNPGKGNDNLYLWGDFSAAIPQTPLTAKAHIGHSDGNSGLGPNGTSAAPTGHYWDWLLGADYAIKGTPLTLSAYYVDTDISKAKAAYLQPNFASTKDGSTIAGSQVVFSISAAF